MEQIANYLSGLPAFLAYFATAAALTVAYVYIYTHITRHNELALIKENVVSAAIALSGSLLGFALPLASAITNSLNLLDCLLWGVIALIVQLLAYFAVRLFMPGISDRIEANELSAGMWLGVVSLSAGILNAASMSY